MSDRRLILGAVVMNNGSHALHGLWRLPEAQKQREFERLDHWIDFAQSLERGHFDFMFFADIIGAYDVYGGSWEVSVRHGTQFPTGDPLILTTALASHTTNLGFVVTSSVFYQKPYAFARQLSTLDHLSGGRIAWNVVTSVIENGARNSGLDGLPAHDDRYVWAEEFLDVTLKLWERSWDDGALVRDVESGVFVDTDKIHEIGHQGKQFSVQGPHHVPPSPQRTPVLLQAGGSPVGRDFAAANAELTFVTASSPEAAAELVADLRARATDAGREPGDLKFFAGLSIVVGKTEDEARRKDALYEEWIDDEAMLAQLSGHLHVDFASIDLDSPLADLSTDGMQGFLKSLRESVPEEERAQLTFRDLLRGNVLLKRIVGDPQQVADEIARWYDAGIDGIGLLELVRPQTFDDFIEFVVPVLQDRGLVQREYAPGTLREKLFDRGPFLPESHRAHNLPIFDSRSNQ